ncbi:unnamed protein product [Phytomonas sp. Hart1]|nr:unnamed protein product [Phytomonas sp. Hart1]|eukprot:CCW69325.1 unnamed protein product [Phytomonas sp. isolate Hart1]
MERDSLPVLNRAFLQDATAPSLSIAPLHNYRNTGRRSFRLMQRQQYYTQSDMNLIASKELVNMPTERPNRRGSKANAPQGGVSLLGMGQKDLAELESEFKRLT